METFYAYIIRIQKRENSSLTIFTLKPKSHIHNSCSSWFTEVQPRPIDAGFFFMTRLQDTGFFHVILYKIKKKLTPYNIIK